MSSNRMETNFVRGKQKKNADMSDDEEEKAPKDVLFGNTKSKKRKTTSDNSKSGKKKIKVTDDSSDITKLEPNEMVSALTYKQLQEGMLILGAVKQINDLDVSISLPNGLTGFLSLRETSDVISDIVDKFIQSEEDADDDGRGGIPSLSDMFYIGQYVRCVIVKLEQGKKSKRIELSMRATLLNTGIEPDMLQKGTHIFGTVQSREEHGYTVHLGIDCDDDKTPLMGFLPLKSVEKKNLCVGTSIECLVHKTTGGDQIRSAILTMKHDKVIEKVTEDHDDMTIHSIKPGILVEATITRILPSHGLIVTIFGVIKATIDITQFHDSSVNLLSFNEGKVLKARVLHVNPATQLIGLSCQKHIIQMEPFSVPNECKIGSTGDNAIVTRVLQEIGLFLKFSKDDGKEIRCFSHISQISDNKITDLYKNYTEGTKHSFRVLSYDYIDGIARVSLNPDVIKNSIFQVDDLSIGQIVTGKVSQIKNSSVLVTLSKSVQGLCSNMHLADVSVRDPSLKFPIGKEIKCRVLKIDNTRVYLTHKKSLMNTKYPILSSWKACKRGTISQGVVNAIKPFGISIEFFNGIYGTVSMNELKKAGLQKDQHVNDVFPIGSTIKCAILSHNPIAGKLQLSIVVGNDDKVKEDLLNNNNTNYVTYPVKEGDIIQGTLISLDDETEELIIKISDHPDVPCRLPSTHLTDHPSHSKSLFQYYKSCQGEVTFPDLLVLYTTKNYVVVSWKRSLRDAMSNNELPSNIDDVIVNKIYHGYVKKVTDYGVFIGYLGSLSSLAHKRNLSHYYVSNPNALFQQGQSVSSYIESIDMDTQRIVSSLLLSKCILDVNEEGVFGKSYFDEMDMMEEAKYDDNNNKFPSKKIFPGAILQAKVQSIKSVAVLVEFIDYPTLHGLAIRPYHTNEMIKKNDIILCKVLSIDIRKGIIDISIREDMIKDNMKNNKNIIDNKKIIKNDMSKLKIGQSVEGIVQLIRDHFIVVSIPEINNIIGLASATTYNMESVPVGTYIPGSKVKLSVYKIPKKVTGKLLFVIDRNEMATKKKNNNSNNNNGPFYDEQLSLPTDIKQGMIIKVRLNAIRNGTGLVSLVSKYSQYHDNFSAKISLADVIDYNKNKMENALEVLKSKVGEFIQAKVISLNDDNNDKLKIDFTILPSELESQGIVKSKTYKHGDKVTAYVTYIDPSSYTVYVSIKYGVHGRIQAINLGINNNNELKDIINEYKIGTPIVCYIIDTNNTNNVELSINKPSKKEIQIGDNVTIIIRKAIAGLGFMVAIANGNYHGKVHLTDICNEWTKKPLRKYKIGDITQGIVVGSNKKAIIKHRNNDSDDDNDNDTVMTTIYDISIRNANNDNNDSKDERRVDTIDDCIEGRIVNGYIKECNSKGAFIMLSRSLTARVLLKDLSDHFVRNIVEEFTPGKLVSACIMHVDKSRGRVDMSMRKSIMSELGDKPMLKFSEIKVGDVYAATITNITDIGVFLVLKNSRVTGLCHISQVADVKVSKDDIIGHYDIGDKVRTIVIKVTPDKQRVSFGLKPSLFKDIKEDDMVDDDDEDNNDNDMNEDSSSESESEDDEVDDSEEEDDDDDDDNSMSDDDNNTNHKISSKTTSMFSSSDIKALPMDFDLNTMDDKDNNNESSSDDDSDDNDDKDLETNTKASRRTKHANKKREEKELALMEENLLHHDRAPESAADFERLVAAEPNNSFHWIQYIAYHIGLTEFEKARKIGLRSLDVISFRQQDERFNIWMALLNLENMYGNDDTFNDVINKALQVNDKAKIYLSVAQMFAASEKIDKAKEYYKILNKKYSSFESWTKYGEFLYRIPCSANDIVDCRNKALKRLPKDQHISIITKFAGFEYKLPNGNIEKGRTLFDSILTNYPKKVDVWSVYIDAEISAYKKNKGNETKHIIRKLFERVLSIPLSFKKVKFLYKKYLKFEEEFGTEQTQAEVKEKALEYVQSKMED